VQLLSTEGVVAPGDYLERKTPIIQKLNERSIELNSTINSHD